jgi:hypothetical protein
VAPLTELIADIRREFPRFELLPKQHSWFMRALNVLLLVLTCGAARGFMTRYTTVIGCKVYIPEGWHAWPWALRAEVLRHERVHLRQQRSWGALQFSLLYLFVPVPVLWAYWRTRFEMAAYEESMRARLEYLGRDSFTPAYKRWLVRQFTGPSYFWMWVSRRQVECWYDEVLRGLSS